MSTNENEVGVRLKRGLEAMDAEPTKKCPYCSKRHSYDSGLCSRCEDWMPALYGGFGALGFWLAEIVLKHL